MALDKIKTAMIEDDAVTAAKIVPVTAAMVATDVATQSELDAVESDADKIQTNLAVLAFKVAVNNDLVKYNLKDQIIDEFEDASGVDAGASTNETLTAGVYKGAAAPSVTGGVVSAGTAIGDYTYHYYTATGNSTLVIPTGGTTIELLMVGGGGQGGSGTSGGGGAGGLIYISSVALPAGTYTTTVGVGGSGNVAADGVGDAGSDTVITDNTRTFTAIGGGGGGGYSNVYLPATDGGGSAGAHTGYQSGQSNLNTAETPTSPFAAAGGDITTGGVTYSNVAFGNNGGIQYQGGGNGGAGGGGGAGGVGENGFAYDTANGGDGGVGKAIANFNHTVWGGSSNTYYAAGGGGSNLGRSNNAASGIGGISPAGGSLHAADPGATGGALANTGSGGGGTWNHGTGIGGDGSKGIIVLRYSTETIGDLILQSTDTAAETEADYADMVMLIEDVGGTPAVINTDIKGFISEDSGVTFTEGVLVDEGDWGTNKRILAFHDLDISAQSGTAMCYKITTHNQTTSKTTKIHSASIGWR